MQPLAIGRHTLAWGARTYVMGIVNATPDSFSGDGLLAGEDAVSAALAQARRFVDAGADILDVGGESTRPGSQPVDADEELARVIPIIRAIVRELPGTLVSVDTYKAAVAEEALDAGAHIVNDVWGLRGDPGLAEVVARKKAPVVLMHNRSNPASVEVRARLGSAYAGAEYDDLLEDVKRELLESVALAHEAGIPDERIILDPGVGFGKTVEQNLELVDRLDEIRALGYPILLGPSRKSFIGYTLDLPPGQRVEGTAASAAVGIVRGADIIRIHDVTAMARVARMTDAIVRRSAN
ncbi:MAG: dihydropteroate synthase [Chloroflexi bacterium]|nr:dihydropteroate synthase [Chloroflexota bacterium]